MSKHAASLIIAVSIIVLSIGAVADSAAETVIDPADEQALAARLVDHDAVRSTLAARLGDGLRPSVPDNVPVSDATLTRAMNEAVATPEVQAVLAEAVANGYRTARARPDEETVLSSSSLADLGWAALAADIAGLDADQPPIGVQVELPTMGVGWALGMSDSIDRWAARSAFVAVVAMLLALLVARERAKVLVRVAAWMACTAVGWAVIGSVVPLAVALVAPSSAAMSVALIDWSGDLAVETARWLALGAAISLAVGLTAPLVRTHQARAILKPPTVRVGSRSSDGSRPTLRSAPVRSGIRGAARARSGR